MGRFGSLYLLLLAALLTLLTVMACSNEDSELSVTEEPAASAPSSATASPVTATSSLVTTDCNDPRFTKQILELSEDNENPFAPRILKLYSDAEELERTEKVLRCKGTASLSRGGESYITYHEEIDRDGDVFIGYEIGDAVSTPTPATRPLPGLTLDNPLSAGEVLQGFDGTEVRVLGVVEDARQQVAEENRFNAPPKDGKRFYIIFIEFSYPSGSGSVTVSDSDFNLIGENRVVYEPFEHTCGVIPNELDGEIYGGGKIQGNICFEIPEDEGGLILIHEPGFAAESRRFLNLPNREANEPTAATELTAAPITTPKPTAILTPESTPTQAPTTTLTLEPTRTPESTPTQAPTATPTLEPTRTPEPTPVAIGTTVEVGGSSYTLNEVMDPAPAGIFGVKEGKRLVALDITQVGISDDGDSYNPLNFAIQDTDGYVYTPALTGADVEPRFGAGKLAAGQIVRGWVVFELPESARLVSVLADHGVFGASISIADFAQGQVGDLVSQTAPPVPAPPSSPVAIGTTVEVGGSSYTLNEVMDPAPRGIFGVKEGKRLVALDITQVGISDDGDSYNPLNFAIQDTDGYVYTPALTGADVEPRFGAGKLAAGQMVRGWVVFELPESARLVSVLADHGVFGASISIADFAQGQVGDLVSQTAPPVPAPPSSPVAIGTTVEVGGSSYTLNEVMDPAPAGIFGVKEGKRLVALDITQVGISDDGDSYNPLNFAIQDTDGYVYTPALTGADVEPRFGAGKLAAGQMVRGWVVFELPESARLVSVLADHGVFGASISIADLF